MQTEACVFINTQDVALLSRALEIVATVAAKARHNSMRMTGERLEGVAIVLDNELSFLMQSIETYSCLANGDSIGDRV